MSNPLITAIIPCRNEEKYIAQCLKSLLEQKDVNDKMEILVVDGMSTDNTRAIVEKISKQYSQVKLLDNLSLYTPHGLNMGIKNAKGEFIAIFGAHAEYDIDYVSNSLRVLQEHLKVVCTGGPVLGIGRGNFARAVALAMSSPIGVGNAKHHFPDYEGYVEGIGFPVFRREVFEKIGLYDEELIRNQDDELNLRLRKCGLKIYLSPKIKSHYYVRETPKELYKQYYNYGFWRVAVIKKHKLPASIRQIVPGLFIISIFFFLTMGLLVPYHKVLLSFFAPALYFLFLLAVTIKISFDHGLKIGKYFPLAVSTLHFAYGFGFIKGLLLIFQFNRKSEFKQ